MSREELEDALKKWVDRTKAAEKLVKSTIAENNVNVVQLSSAKMYLMAVVDSLNNFAPLSAVSINKDHAFELFNTKEIDFSQDDEIEDMVYLTLIDKPKVDETETVENEKCAEAANSKTS
jgi:hypothetical protein